MRKRFQLLVIVGLLLSLSLIGSAAQSQGFDEPAGSTIRLVRATDLEELGIGRAFGTSYSAADSAFLFIEDDPGPPSGSPAVTFKVVSRFDELVDTVPVAVSPAEAAHVVFDAQRSRFLLLDIAGDDLIEVEADPRGRPRPEAVARHHVGYLGVEEPRGQAIDRASGHLYILDGAGPSLVRLDLNGANGLSGSSQLSGSSHLSQGPFRRIELSASGLADARGLAIDPASGSIHIFDAADQTLHELSATGRPITVRDLSGMGIDNLQGMLFAPTGDLTDEASSLSLYLLDDAGAITAVSQEDLLATTAEEGETTSGSGRLLEFSFAPAPVPAAATTTSSLIQTIHAWQFDPPSTDSAGVVYLPDSNSLLMSDSEVNETSFFTGVNLFRTTLGGTLTETMSTMSYSDEPTGITYNPANDHLFISDDTSREIYEVNPGPDGQYDTSDDVVTSIDTRDMNSADPEGVSYDSWGGRLLLVDGKDAEVYIVDPGNNGLFDGVPPAGDDTVTSIDTATHGITDPEGVAFNYENGNLYVVGKPTDTVAELTIGGNLVQTIDISAAAADKPAGLAYGPRSNDPLARSIYIAERGNDSTSVKDGKIYEMSVTSSTLPPPVPITPTGVSSDTTPAYSWQEASSATDYQLYLLDQDGQFVYSEWLSAASVCAAGTCSHTPATALDEADYKWFVRASDGAGTSPWSVATLFTVFTGNAAPGAATLLAPSGVIGDLTPTFSWQTVPNAIRYRVYLLDGDRLFAHGTIVQSRNACSAGTCTYTMPTPLPDGDYRWFIRAENPLGGIWSAPMLFTVFTGSAVPGAANLLAPSGVINDTTPTYLWNEVAQAIKYKVYVVDGDSLFVYSTIVQAQNVCVAGSCSFTTPVPLADGDYRWFIQAINPLGGTWSAPLPFSLSAGSAP